MPKGKLVIKKPEIIINEVELTTRISSVTIDTGDDEVDLSTFGSQWKETGVGLSDASFAMTVMHDFNTEANKVHTTLWPLKSEGKKFVAEIVPEKATVEASNPCFMMCGFLFGYNPLAGAIGEASTADVTIKNAASIGLVVATEAGTRTTNKALLKEYAEGKK